MKDPQSVPNRIVSLDQYRGYTVLGMFLVNFVGGFSAIKTGLPLLAHHHTYCSYADTIMPQFFVAAGFAYRLTFLRRRDTAGVTVACRTAIRRNFALLLIAALVYGFDGKYELWAQLQNAGIWGVLSTAFQRNFFQTLAHIAVTSLWILPVIGASVRVRIGYAIASGVLFHLLSVAWYYEWVLKRPGIDGGPLGFLTWTIPMIAGTLAYDVVTTRPATAVRSLLTMGAGLMLLGYGLSTLPGLIESRGDIAAAHWTAPPFVPPSEPVNIWTMSQRAGSVSYLTFGAGFGLAVLALFVLACDGWRWQSSLLRTLGNNALAAYILHDVVNTRLMTFIPKDSPLWLIFTGFALSLLICTAILRWMERRKLYLTL